MSDDMTAGGYTGHCCQCAGVCHHTSPPAYCQKHGGNTNTWPVPGTNPMEPWNPMTPYQPFPMPANGRYVIEITEADIDRIARRVVELLRQADDSEAKGEYPSG